jgi:hypothetical protein
LSNNGRVSCSEADTSSGSSCALGSKESDVLGFENVSWWLERWIDMDVLRFSGKRSIVDFHLIALVNNYIAWDVLTTLDDDNISWNDVLSINLLLDTISDNCSNWWNEILELCHHFCRFGCLGIRETPGQKGNSSKYDTEIQIGLITLVDLDTISNETKERSEPKQKGEETCHLTEKDTIPWL